MPRSASEIRDLLRLVKGVQAVEVSQSADGSIERIDVAVSVGLSSARVIRDVESALLSGLGIAVDHRSIRVTGSARNGNGRAGEAPAADSGQEEAERPPIRLVEPEIPRPDRIRLLSVRCESDGELWCEATVEIARGGEQVSATVREADTRRGRLQAAARAALDAVTHLSPGELAIAVDGIEEFEIGDEQGLVAAFTVRQGRERRRFQGASLVEGDPENATVRAVLDGLNRYWAALEGVA